MAMIKTCKMPTLQEKSASGAVASFNTALAMPLASCNIAVNAWQEGSGTPSPYNVRTINGYSTLNIMATGKNLFDISILNQGGVSVDDGIARGLASAFEALGTIPLILPSGCIFSFDARNIGTNITDTRGLTVQLIYEDDTNVRQNILNSTTSFTTFSIVTTKSVKGIFIGFGSGGDNIWELKNMQCEVGTTATAYEAYNGNTYSIQIGSTVYGGEYDARTGVLTVKYVFVDLGTLNWGYSGSVFHSSVIPTLNSPTNNIICSSYETVPYNIPSANMPDKSIKCYGGVENRIIYIKDSNYTDAAVFKTAMSGVQLVYELATPTTIQLPSCQIYTLNGVNNIFADTGDIDLTFNDLDIAKRGNFREVFRLP